jgi:Cu+-exporting ATPase
MLEVSRYRRRSPAMADTVTDPVCGMQIRPEDAVAQEVHDGQTFYFCSPGCHEAFLGDPHKYGHP